VVVPDRPQTAPASPTRLPRELILIYLVAPLIATPVLSGSFFELRPREMMREAAANYLAFLSIAAGIHALYHFAMPALARRIRSRLLQLALHVCMSGLVALAAAFAIYPAVSRLFVDGPTLGTWLFRCVAITWTVLLPALAVQELRNRAESVERRLSAQRQ